VVFQGSENFGPAFATKNENFHFSVAARDSGRGPKGLKAGRDDGIRGYRMGKILDDVWPLGLKLDGQKKSSMR
jgi:hypothetical protein